MGGRQRGAWKLGLGLSLVLVGCSSEESAGEGPCAGVDCSGHGNCVEVAGAPACQCDPGYAAEGLACVDASAGLPTADHLEQWGVGWTFERAVPYGTFANGDYWVLGPVVVTEMSPAASDDHHGWEVNPADTTEQAFDARIADYVAGRMPALPLEAGGGESIVKAISTEPLDDAECGPCLQTAAVLTVVAEVPPDRGASVLRPPYFGAEKPYYSTLPLVPAALPTLTATEHAPSLADSVPRFERVQLDHKQNWTGRAMHPADNMPDYGSDIATRNAEGALALTLDYAAEDKRLLLIHLLQQGIDLYHMALGGQIWPPGGGHGEGRKLPVAMAAWQLGDAAMQQFVSHAAIDAFGENGGMYSSDAAGVVLFGQTPNSEEAYWTNLVFDTGSRTIIDPYRWIDGGHEPGWSYQFCCTAKAWKATAAAVRLLGLESLWNHADFFAYVDRWVGFGAWTQPDPCAPPDGVCAGGDNVGAACTLASAPTVCTGTDALCDTTGSWETSYGVTYGPDGAGGCILDTDDTDGIGRFPLLHGINADGGYHGSQFADEMWAAYVE